MHVKCRYCGTECWDLTARAGHEPLCDQNPANRSTVVPAPLAPAAEVKAPEMENHTAPALVFTTGKYAGQTPGRVILTDRSYVEWAASLHTDPAIKAQCRELLATVK
jgi:hypothetical protein